MPQIVVMKSSKRIVGEVDIRGNFVVVEDPSVYNFFERKLEPVTFAGSLPLKRITVPLHDVEMILEAKT